MNEQATKDTPWTAEYDGHGGVSLETAGGVQIACLKSSRKDDADRIVRSVNCHAELLEACLRAFHVFENDTTRKREVMGVIEAAITKAQDA